MKSKKKIIAFLFLLFAFHITSGAGNIIACGHEYNIKIGQRIIVAQNSLPSAKENIFEVSGILQPSVNINESNSPAVQHYKNIKKNGQLIAVHLSIMFHVLEHSN